MGHLVSVSMAFPNTRNCFQPPPRSLLYSGGASYNRLSSHIPSSKLLSTRPQVDKRAPLGPLGGLGPAASTAPSPYGAGRARSSVLTAPLSRPRCAAGDGGWHTGKPAGLFSSPHPRGVPRGTSPLRHSATNSGLSMPLRPYLLIADVLYNQLVRS